MFSSPFTPSSQDSMPSDPVPSSSVVKGAAEPSQPDTCVAVTCDDRWQLYHRLQALDIQCQCGSYQPLQVWIKTPMEAVQLWSIMNRLSEPRLVLADRLHRCWQAPSAQ